MKIPPRVAKNLVPVVALMIGLSIGLTVSFFQIKREQNICQDKIKEANRKIAFFQKKITEEKTEAMAALEQQCQGDLSTLRNTLQHEKKVLSAELGSAKEYARKLELKARESDEASARTRQELKDLARNNQELDRELKKTIGEKQTLHAKLTKTVREFGNCASNNAELCVIAEELINKYKNKGIGAALLEKDPLIQVKQVELEQLTQTYQEEIEQRKMKKNDMKGKRAVE